MGPPGATVSHMFTHESPLVGDVFIVSLHVTHCRCTLNSFPMVLCLGFTWIKGRMVVNMFQMNNLKVIFCASVDLIDF